MVVWVSVSVYCAQSVLDYILGQSPTPCENYFYNSFLCEPFPINIKLNVFIVQKQQWKNSISSSITLCENLTKQNVDKTFLKQENLMMALMMMVMVMVMMTMMIEIKIQVCIFIEITHKNRIRITSLEPSTECCRENDSAHIP